MKLTMYCESESVSSYIGKTGAHYPLTLSLRDEGIDGHKMKEMVELRFEGDDKEKLSGKCEGHRLVIGMDRMNKFNGVARIDGKVLEILPNGSPGTVKSPVK